MTDKRQVKRVSKSQVQSKKIEREIRRAIGVIDSYKKKYPQEYQQVISQLEAKTG